MADIFLSYASEDLERIKPLAFALAKEGWSVFYDRTVPPGKTWRNFIGKQVEDCRCMVVCWSKHSIKSHWVSEEADDALKRKILIPLFLEQVKPPFGFVSIQGVDLVSWKNDVKSNGYQLLRSAIEDLIGPIITKGEKVLDVIEPEW